MYIVGPYSNTLNMNDKIILFNYKNGNRVIVKEKYYEHLLSLLRNNRYSQIKANNSMYSLFKVLRKTEFIIPDNKFEEASKIPMDVVYIATTNKCNLSCRHCGSSSFIQVEDFFTTDELVRVLQKVIDIKPHRIVISGGEPLIRKDIIHILEFTRLHYNGLIVLSTNGTLINATNVKKLCSLVDKITISMDGYDEESCSKIRGKGVFDKCINGIELLHKEKFYEISLSMVITKYTTKKELFYSLCKRYEATPVFRNFQPFGRGYDNYANLSVEDSANKDYCLSCKACFPGKRELMINYDGEIYPCAGTSLSKVFSMGNILNNNLDNLLPNFRQPADAKGIALYRSWNCPACRECKIRGFCSLCLGEKYQLIYDDRLEKDYCTTYREYIYEKLKEWV